MMGPIDSIAFPVGELVILLKGNVLAFTHDTLGGQYNR
jgi:hypothetical protein